MTLLECSILVTALVILASILFFGARAWIKGSDRTACILSIRNVQMAIRAYQNTHGYDYGSQPLPEIGTQDIAKHLFYRGYIEQRTYDEIEGVRDCPSGGKYSCPTPDLFPLSGSLYVTCSLAGSQQHEPSSRDSW